VIYGDLIIRVQEVENFNAMCEQLFLFWFAFLIVSQHEYKNIMVSGFEGKLDFIFLDVIAFLIETLCNAFL
jgi:hypothetical protein